MATKFCTVPLNIWVLSDRTVDSLAEQERLPETIVVTRYEDEQDRGGGNCSYYVPLSLKGVTYVCPGVSSGLSWNVCCTFHFQNSSISFTVSVT